MGRTRYRAAPRLPKPRECKWCGLHGLFEAGARICNDCKADPTARVRHGAEKDRIMRDRARNEAVGVLRSRHREEYDRLFADALAAMRGMEDWEHAPLDERLAFAERLESLSTSAQIL